MEKGEFEKKFAKELETWHPAVRSLGWVALRQHELLTEEAFLAVVDLVRLNDRLIEEQR